MDSDAFLYMGGDMAVPSDVVRVEVHPSVMFIPENAFQNQKKLEEVILCDGLKEIGGNAFYSCIALKRVDIPSSVTAIHHHGFCYCSKLEEVNLCEGLIEIGSHSFSECKALKRIRIPSTVIKIHDHAFEFCNLLEHVELCDGLRDIGSYAFFYCSALKSIKIPCTVNLICNRAFANCEKLADVQLCEGLFQIKSGAFFYCTSLEKIKVPSTVSIIEDYVFKGCHNLWKVEICEGLVEIGDASFYECGFDSINIPSTVERICAWAFCHTPLSSLSLHDKVESIGDHAFCNGALATLRVPPLVTTIPKSVCYSSGIFSMELPKSINRIDDEAFEYCTQLRNLALQPNIEIGFNAFKDCADLKQLGSERNVINTLKHRFDNLPIHKILYYQSYHRGRVLRSMLDDPTINQQDVLGMTPLHILACSTLQNVELYRVLIERYPESLVTEDRWGALPLLYAVWANAPNDTEQLLVQSYVSYFPNYKFNWTMMFETLGRANVSYDIMKRLHDIQKMNFHGQLIDWDKVVENAITQSNLDSPDYITTRSFMSLLARSISKRALAIRNKTLQEQVKDALFLNISGGTQGRRDFLSSVHQTLEICEDKFNRLMEALTSIELVLWKHKIDDCCRQKTKTRRSKKMKMDDPGMRKQCRARCGAETNIVISHVMPYLNIQ